MSDPFQRAWELAASRLGLTVDIPFSLEVGGQEIVVPVRLREFGARRGMLLCSEFKTLEPVHRELGDLGFGFSCFREPAPSEVDDAAWVVELLSDWGWSGPGDPSSWLSSQSPEP